MNETLFDVGAEASSRRNQAADAYRRGPYCWEYCGHCGMRTYSAKKLYKLCHLDLSNPVRVYETSEICENHIARIPKSTPILTGPGWEDY